MSSEPVWESFGVGSSVSVVSWEGSSAAGDGEPANNRPRTKPEPDRTTTMTDIIIQVKIPVLGVVFSLFFPRVLDTGTFRGN